MTHLGASQHYQDRCSLSLPPLHHLFAPFHIPPPLQTQRAALPAQLPKLLQKPQPLFKDLNKEHCPVLLTLLSPAVLFQIHMSKGHKISLSKEKPTTKKAYRDGDCPANSTPLSASQHPCFRGQTAMYTCSKGRSALILSNMNTKHEIPSRGQNISELTLRHLYACFVFFFFF